jgi:hypothetical protein
MKSWKDISETYVVLLCSYLDHLVFILQKLSLSSPLHWLILKNVSRWWSRVWRCQCLVPLLQMNSIKKKIYMVNIYFHIWFSITLSCNKVFVVRSSSLAKLHKAILKLYNDLKHWIKINFLIWNLLYVPLNCNIIICTRKQGLIALLQTSHFL